MSIRIQRPMISSIFLWLSRGSFSIFLFIFLILLSILSRVPSTQLLFGEARSSFDLSECGPRRRILQPLPFLPPPLLLLQCVVWLLRQSWHSFNTWMLTLILSPLSCIRWHPCWSYYTTTGSLWWLRYFSISFSRGFWGWGCCWWWWWWWGWRC